MIAYDDGMNLKDKSISEIVQSVIEEACAKRASDIHFSPQTKELRIRIRVDGLLSDSLMIPKTYHEEIIARLKVVAHLRSDEHHRPQDGRFTFLLSTGEKVDIRISIVSTYHGENAVLRLLRTQSETPTLSGLGFSTEDQKKIEKALLLRSGMILVTGPTGSGKTTTLYSLLSTVSRDDVSLVTLEDPIEYSLEGITQIQIHPHSGITFPQTLRSVLRQDPDSIMVGEIRDSETARISINAALTGHLLFSTLHTIDAVSVLPRLLDMGIEPYLIASTVKLIISQRLVRKREGAEFQGRTVIAEVLEVTQEIIEEVLKKSSHTKIKALALSQGMTEIMNDGLQKVEQGETTLPEVLRVVHE